MHLVAQAIKRSRADLSGRRRPASFIFVGPTGVGKTELVKQLANQLFDGPDPLIRLDMSEYMEKYAVSRMIYLLHMRLGSFSKRYSHSRP